MNISDGTGVSLLTSIKEMARGRWPSRAPTKKRRDEAKIAPFNEPKVAHATKTGIKKEAKPSILSPKVIATASEAKMSFRLKTVKYATLVTT